MREFEVTPRALHFYQWLLDYAVAFRDALRMEGGGDKQVCALEDGEFLRFCASSKVDPVECNNLLDMVRKDVLRLVLNEQFHARR